MIKQQANTPPLAARLSLGVALVMLGGSQSALAHVEYYDLNQGAQISDLTAAGKAASTAQYGSTPASVVALSGGARGLGTIVSTVDLPLNDPNKWNSTYQSYTGNGSFSNVVYTPNYSSATVNVNDVTDFGWGDGTYATTPNPRTGGQLLGDGHKVDWFNFRLAEDSKVTITWNVDTAGTYIDNGFTLYRGLLSYQGHDDAAEKLNPRYPVVPKVQGALDAVNAPVDVQGIASSYRNTLTNSVAYFGQFNALANWGQANVAGNWSNAQYVAHANAKTIDNSSNASDTLETLVINLTAGNYAIGASGALGALGSGNSSFGLTNLHGVLTFQAVANTSAVPVPGAVWLFGSAMLGFLGLSRLKVALVA